ncbi:MAG: biopolymer transporter ExbD [candidate division KSB1 bacterium]|nr:biopolymer transporter ExbD [candidate division KSB1 bacterium]MDZ7319796.1 biopolymer transporter ExbD [candidate division KSB1 bacterium]MDZ7340775.1 biopolymer transporter ExbD [candidate division KSB1 bacterium]
MNGTKLMLRLIDVVFNLLFAFIAISQIGFNMAIELPKSTEAAAEAPESANIVIIGVTQTGTYPVERGDQEFKSIQEVQRYLIQKQQETRRQGAQLGVRIRADWNSPVEYGMALARLCRDLGIPKGLDVVRLDAK